MFSSFWNFLTAPTMPRVALAISPSHLALVELQKRGGNFNPKRIGLQTLPNGIVSPSLTELNVLNEAAFIEQLNAAADQANFGRRIKLSVGLPEGSTRSLVVTLEQKPKTREELLQMLGWKISRALNIKPVDLQISYRQLRDDKGQPRWLVSAVHQQVLAQFERLLADFGWQAGAILPQHLGEAQWLLRGDIAANEDQVLVSTHLDGFVVVILRHGEPLLIRDVTCTKSDYEDELFRLMIFYRDRLNPTQPLKRMLIVAEPAEQALLSKAVSAALEYLPSKLSPPSLGLNLESAAPFDRLAAATGLATLAY